MYVLWEKLITQKKKTITDAGSTKAVCGIQISHQGIQEKIGQNERTKEIKVNNRRHSERCEAEK